MFGRGQFYSHNDFTSNIATGRYTNNPVICVKDVIFPLTAESNAHKHAPRHGKCGGRPHPIYRAYSKYLLESHGIFTSWVGDLHEGGKDTSSKFTVIVMDRPVGLLRRMTNMHELIPALQQAVGPDGEVRLIDPAKIPIREFLIALSSASLFIGGHGAALYWLVALPKCASVMEFTAWGQWHYEGLAVLNRTRYLPIDGGMSWGSALFTAPVREAVAQVNITMGDWRRCWMMPVDASTPRFPPLCAPRPGVVYEESL
jgi:hypothetical protein